MDIKMEDKDILSFMELQQKINITDREMIRELEIKINLVIKAILLKEKYGQLCPDTIKELKEVK